MKQYIGIFGLLLSMGAFGFWVCGQYFPRYKEVPVEIEAPVMARIMECESQNKHLDKNGQVKISLNKNGTVDIGIAQINLTYWGATAGTMGLDLTKEEDNKAFAMWLYKNHGTGDWSSSEKCWNK